MGGGGLVKKSHLYVADIEISEQRQEREMETVQLREATTVAGNVETLSDSIF